jgi:outer membrane protein OmpA-like peptidoglycan-associated protein
MRKWCVTAVIGAALALPVWAQQNSTGADETAAKPESSSGATSAIPGANTPGGSGLVRSARHAFALPESPKAKAFPPSATTPDTTAPGRVVPKYEIAGMFDYMNVHPGDPFNAFNSQGGSGSFTYNASRWLGLTAELGGLHYDRNVFPLTGNNKSVSGGLTTYLFGPRLNLRKFDHFVPFGEFLLGGAHAGNQLTGDKNQSAFALAAGGGIDIVFTRYLAWRFAQFDYVMTNFSGVGVGGNARQDNFRAGTGIVLRFGFPKPPPPVNHPPVAACSVNPASVYTGSGDSVAVHVDASDPDSDPLTYTYTATGGTVQGTGPDARWSSAGTAVGTYTVNAKVDDGRGGTASCSTDIRVEEKPHHPPTISCAPDRSPIMPGERATITSTANSPDGLDLTYSYSTSGGQVVGSGKQVQFDSTGVAPGSYKINCSVADTRGDKADSSTSVDVQQPPPPPQATKVGDCGYTKPAASRFDNACKRVGDDVALRLKNDPSSKLVIVGYADPKEPKPDKLASTRAELAKKYIEEKGIDGSRITTRTGKGSTEKGAEKENRRVDFVLVPEGATY